MGAAIDRKAAVEAFPDLATVPDEELKQLIERYQAEEREVSFRRRMLHGYIDMLRAELVARLQRTEGRSVLEEVDVNRLTEILAAKAPPPDRP
jgi:hypothetical protein